MQILGRMKAKIKCFSRSQSPSEPVDIAVRKWYGNRLLWFAIIPHGTSTFSRLAAGVCEWLGLQKVSIQKLFCSSVTDYRHASASPWKRSLPNSLCRLHPDRPPHMAGWAGMVVEQEIGLGNSRASSAYLGCDKNHHSWDEDNARLHSFQLHYAQLHLRFSRQKRHFCQKVVCLLLLAVLQLRHQFDRLIWVWKAPRWMFTLRASCQATRHDACSPPTSASYRAHARLCLCGGIMRRMHELAPSYPKWNESFEAVWPGDTGHGQARLSWSCLGAGTAAVRWWTVVTLICCWMSQQHDVTNASGRSGAQRKAKPLLLCKNTHIYRPSCLHGITIIYSIFNQTAPGFLPN